MSDPDRTDAIEAAAAAVARAIEAYNVVDRCGDVAALIETFAENDEKLVRAAGLLACDKETTWDNGAEEALALIAEVRDSLEWSIRRPLSKAGVMAPDAKPVRE